MNQYLRRKPVPRPGFEPGELSLVLMEVKFGSLKIETKIFGDEIPKIRWLLDTVTMKIDIFSDIMRCTLVDVYRRFG